MVDNMLKARIYFEKVKQLMLENRAEDPDLIGIKPNKRDIDTMTIFYIDYIR